MKTKSERKIVGYVVREGNVPKQGRYQGIAPFGEAQGDEFANWGPRENAYRSDTKYSAERWAKRGGGRVVPIVKVNKDRGLHEVIANLTERFSKVEQDNFRLRAQIRRIEPLPVPDVNDELARELTFWKDKASRLQEAENIRQTLNKFADVEARLEKQDADVNASLLKRAETETESWKAKAQQLEGALKLYELSDVFVSSAADLIAQIREQFAIPEHQTTLDFVTQVVGERGMALADVECLKRSVQEYVKENRRAKDGSSREEEPAGSIALYRRESTNKSQGGRTADR